MCTCGNERVRNLIFVDPTVRFLELFELQLGGKIELGWGNPCGALLLLGWPLLLLGWPLLLLGWPLLLLLRRRPGFPVMAVRRLSSRWAGNGCAAPLLRLLRLLWLLAQCRPPCVRSRGTDLKSWSSSRCRHRERLRVAREAFRLWLWLWLSLLLSVLVLLCVWSSHRVLVWQLRFTIAMRL
jgi:hypothetical protein